MNNDGAMMPFSPDSHARGTLVFSTLWLLAVPLLVWFAGAFYLPIMAPFLGTVERWLLAVLLVGLVGVSVMVHGMAHLWAAGVRPGRVPLYPFGDVAQVWPQAQSVWREIVSASAGPLANLLIGALAYGMWELQWNRYLDAPLLFVAIINLMIALVNSAPGYPLDGGRLVRVALGAVSKSSRNGNRWAERFGYLLILLAAGWGLYLLLQQARYSVELGVAMLAVAFLLLWVLRLHRSAENLVQTRDKGRLQGAGSRWLRVVGAALLIALQLAGTVALLPMPEGVEAPGFVLPVEPLVSVPPEYRHPTEGQFILTTVIQQTPILFGQWVHARLDPVLRVVPAAQIVPPGMTPQELMQRNFQLLLDSETVAAAVALELADYPVEFRGEGVMVFDVAAESPAAAVLMPGDRIVALNEEPVQTLSELVDGLAEVPPDAVVTLRVVRDGQEVVVETGLLPPIAPLEPPRLGIFGDTAGLEVDLPFEVEIREGKIAGGPSAGLMFTLTIYNLLTEEDLTGGQRIAGTGTINPDGTVGPIGGVTLKVAAAERAGARYFLVPPANYPAAVQVAREITVLPVATAQEAIAVLRTLTE